MDVLVYGAGAIGGYLGSRLFAAGHQVTLLDRPEVAERINGEGLVISEAGKSIALNPPAGQKRKGQSSEACRFLTLPSRRGRMALGSVSTVALPSMHAQKSYHNCSHSQIEFFKVQVVLANVKEFRKENPTLNQSLFVSKKP